MRPLIFVVDDDPVQVALVTGLLEATRTFRTRGFTQARDALQGLSSEPADAIVADLRMPQMDGLEFTRRVRETHPTLPIIIVTASGAEGDAERAFEAGASDFVAKPFTPDALRTRLRRSLDEAPAREILSHVAQERFDPDAIVGSHPLVEEVRTFAQQVARVRQVPVLLLGESGTGKNLVARAIHGLSAEARYRFVEVNCAALPSNLVEAELFGYEKGAFTDAQQTKKGLAETADGGTLFLDEIGTLSLEMQAKLLSFLESRSFRRVGGTEQIQVNLRVIAATNVNLRDAVAQGDFREDLYYRLDVASQTLPPLRKIRSDIPLLAHHFVHRAAKYFGKPDPELATEGLQKLAQHSWPGNARELRNVVERSMIFSVGPVLRITEPAGLPSSAAPSATNGITVPHGLTLEQLERLYIRATLEEVDHNVAEAASRLGISRKVLWQRRKQHGLYD